MNTEAQLAAAEKIANKEPEDEPENVEQELSAYEMDLADERAERRAYRFNGGAY